MRASVLQTSNEGSAASGAPAGFDVGEAQMVERELERASDSDSLQGDQQHLVTTPACRAQGMPCTRAARLHITIAAPEAILQGQAFHDASRYIGLVASMPHDPC